MALLCRMRVLNYSFKLHQPLQITPVLGNHHYSSAPSGASKGAGKSEPTGTVNANVPGLSKNVCDVPNSEVGPGASKSSQYKNPEYFCYHSGSYFEAEVEMLKYRCPQPSSKTPLVK